MKKIKELKISVENHNLPINNNTVITSVSIAAKDHKYLRDNLLNLSSVVRELLPQWIEAHKASTKKGAK